MEVKPLDELTTTYITDETITYAQVTIALELSIAMSIRGLYLP